MLGTIIALWQWGHSNVQHRLGHFSWEAKLQYINAKLNKHTKWQRTLFDGLRKISCC